MSNAVSRASARIDRPPYDRLFSRFGLMFFADPAAAFANLHTFLRSAWYRQARRPLSAARSSQQHGVMSERRVMRTASLPRP